MTKTDVPLPARNLIILNPRAPNTGIQLGFSKSTSVHLGSIDDDRGKFEEVPVGGGVSLMRIS